MTESYFVWVRIYELFEITTSDKVGLGCNLLQATMSLFIALLTINVIVCTSTTGLVPEYKILFISQYQERS